VGDSVTISAPQVANATYQWLLNGSPLQGANTNSFTTPVNGTYQVVVTTACGPYTSNPVEITLRSVENVSITNDVIICTGESAELEVTGGTSWSWSPGVNLSDSTSATPVASPRTTTTYVVTIEDDYGCRTTASVTVTVQCDTLNIPNGFSPNGDGKNDTFVIDGLEQFPGTVLTIFNRWGNMVYKQKDYANDWNGTSNVGGTVGGNELPNGTYYYIIDLNKGEKPLSGFVVIRR
jgi:gliding motility-associated-like protein